MKAVLIKDVPHKMLKELSVQRKKEGSFCHRYNDIVADLIDKAHKREVQ